MASSKKDVQSTLKKSLDKGFVVPKIPNKNKFVEARTMSRAERAKFKLFAQTLLSQIKKEREGKLKKKGKEKDFVSDIKVRIEYYAQIKKAIGLSPPTYREILFLQTMAAVNGGFMQPGEVPINPSFFSQFFIINEALQFVEDAQIIDDEQGVEILRVFRNLLVGETAREITEGRMTNQEVANMLPEVHRLVRHEAELSAGDGNGNRRFLRNILRRLTQAERDSGNDLREMMRQKEDAEKEKEQFNKEKKVLKSDFNKVEKKFIKQEEALEKLVSSVPPRAVGVNPSGISGAGGGAGAGVPISGDRDFKEGKEGKEEKEGKLDNEEKKMIKENIPVANVRQMGAIAKIAKKLGVPISVASLVGVYNMLFDNKVLMGNMKNVREEIIDGMEKGLLPRENRIGIDPPPPGGGDDSSDDDGDDGDDDDDDDLVDLEDDFERPFMSPLEYFLASIGIFGVGKELKKILNPENIDSLTDEDKERFKNFVDDFNINNMSNEEKFIMSNMIKTIELHMPSMSFIGPGTNVFRRIQNEEGLKNFLPKKELDLFALQHDMYYSYKDPNAFIKSDNILLDWARPLKEKWDKGDMTETNTQAKALYEIINFKKNIINPFLLKWQKQTGRYDGEALIGRHDKVGTFTEQDEQEINNVFNNYKNFVKNSGINITETGREGNFNPSNQSITDFRNFRGNLSNILKKISPIDIQDETMGSAKSPFQEKLGVHQKNLITDIKNKIKSGSPFTHHEVVALGIILEKFKGKSALKNLTKPDLEYIEKEQRKHIDDIERVDTTGDKPRNKGQMISQYIKRNLESEKSKSIFSQLENFGNNLLSNVEESVKEVGHLIGDLGPVALSKFLKDGDLKPILPLPKKKTAKKMFPTPTAPPTSKATRPAPAVPSPAPPPEVGPFVKDATAPPTTAPPITAPPTTATTPPTTATTASFADEIKKDSRGSHAGFTPAPIKESDIDTSKAMAITSDIQDNLEQYNVIGNEMTTPDAPSQLGELENTEEEKKVSIEQQVLFDHIAPSLWRSTGSTFQQDINIRNAIQFAGPLINLATPKKKVFISNGNPKTTMPFKNIYENNLRGFQPSEEKVRYKLQPALRAGGIQSLTTAQILQNSLFNGM